MKLGKPARPRRRFSFESLEPRLSLDASMLRISEFLASNHGDYRDEDGDASDWIEIYNSGADAVDLSGLYLTDDPSDADKWAFPTGTTLDPQRYLVVFASDKNRAVAASELHTNFKLGADGEFLALVAANGVTVLDQFAPQFPTQFEDISYGRSMSLSGGPTTIVAAGAPSRTLVPTNNILGTSWQMPGFNDASWQAGTTGIGYESNPGDAVNFTNQLGTIVPAGTTTAFVRIEFNLASLAGIDQLKLRMRYDDGFVAYINGVEAASDNAEEPYAFNSIASGSRDDSTALQFFDFDANAGVSALRVGTNVLAIHALNLQGSTDMLMTPALVAQAKTLATPESIGYFSQPTPGYGNGESVEGYTAEPTFSVPHGYYSVAQTVALVAPTPGAVVVYTTNGSTPQVNASGAVTNGTLYTAPINVASTTTLRARAFRTDYEPSSIAASTYLFTSDIVAQSPSGQTPSGWPASGTAGQTMNYGIDPDIINLYGAQAVRDSLASLPAISITTDLANLFDPTTGIYNHAGNRGRTWERPASIEMIHPNGSPGFDVNAGLRIRGGFSRSGGNPKHSWRLFFRSEYGDADLNYPLFGDEGVDEFDKLDLRSEQNYAWHFDGGESSRQTTFVREVFGRDAQRDMGQPYTRSNYVHVYINGVYWGLYQTQERSEEDYAASYFGGSSDDYDVVKSGWNTITGTEIAHGTEVAWRQLFDYGQALKNNPAANADLYWTMQGLNPDGTRNPALPVLLDAQNLIDYMLVLFYTGGWDISLAKGLNNNIGNNWFSVYNRAAADEGFKFFIYDNEHSMGVGGSNHSSQNEDRTGPFNNGNQDAFFYHNPQFLHQDLLASPEYKQRFVDQVQKHMFNGGALTVAKSLARFNALAAEVEPAVIAEAARWGDAQVAVPRNKTDWQNEINWLRNSYFPTRGNTVLTQLRGDGLYTTFAAPTFSQFGGEVASGYQLAVSQLAGATLYYTTDGVTDPRAIGGGVNSSAEVKAYAGPITINSATTVKARFRTSAGQWSGLVEAAFVTPGAAIPGDYDGDGDVAGGDLATWEATYGASVPVGNGADGNRDATVDGADFLFWQRQVGAEFPAAPAAASTASSPLETAIASVELSALRPAFRPNAFLPTLATTVDRACGGIRIAAGDRTTPATPSAPSGRLPQDEWRTDPWRPVGRQPLEGNVSAANMQATDAALEQLSVELIAGDGDWSELARVL